MYRPSRENAADAKRTSDTMNEQNLIDGAHRSQSEVRENGRKGGQASGKARRAKRTMREWAKVIGEMAMPGVKAPDGTLLKGATLDGGVVLSLYQKAVKGDTKAAATLMKLRGELVDKVEHTGEVRSAIIVESKEQKDAIEGLGDLGV